MGNYSIRCYNTEHYRTYEEAAHRGGVYVLGACDERDEAVRLIEIAKATEWALGKMFQQALHNTGDTGVLKYRVYFEGEQQTLYWEYDRIRGIRPPEDVLSYKQYRTKLQEGSARMADKE